MSKSATNSHDYKIVSVAGDKITSTCSKGDQHQHTVAKDAKVTCDGQVCKTADLKTGMSVRITTKKEDSNTATMVESGKQIPEVKHKA